MCGRLILADPADVVAQLLGIVEMPPEWPTRYNLAPTELVPIVREPGRLELFRWGLKLDNPRAGGFNARMESMRLYDTTKRCLVVASSFYEWRRSGASKQPHLVKRTDGQPVVFAGIYDDTGGVAIVTCPASGIIADLHDRMPVVLERPLFDTYLDPETDIGPIFAAASASALTMYPVGPRASSVKNDDPSLIERISEPVAGHAPEVSQLRLF
jgi:putative SOS response-associated peptidase YedK